MDLKTAIPTFNMALRGYDRDEVEEYLDSLASSLAHADDAEEHIRRLQAQVSKMGARIRELEDRIASDTPRTGAILGERIAIMLRQAEETAADTISRAEGDARHIESEARSKASEITTAAEARATARTRQIEDWAQDVIAHARDEEARVLADIARLRERSEDSLRALETERNDAASKLTEIRAALGRALDLIEPTGSVSQPKLAPAPGSAAAASAAAAAAVAGSVAAGGPGAVSVAGSVAASGTGAGGLFDGDAAHHDAARRDAANLEDAAAGGDYSVDDVADATDTVADDTGTVVAQGEMTVVAQGEMTGVDPDALTDDDEAFEAKFEAWVSDTGSVEIVDINKLDRG